MTTRLDIAHWWAQYKLSTLKAALIVAALLAVVAGIFEPVGSWLVDHQFLSAAFTLGLLLLVVDAVISPVQPRSDSVSGRPPILNKTSDLSILFPDLLRERDITIDIASYSSETFYAALAPLLEEIANGHGKVQELHIRLLVPDCSAPMGMPCIASSHRESTAYKKQLVARTDRFVGEFRNYLDRVKDNRPRIGVEFEVRRHRMSPMFKVALLQGNLAYHGIYPIDRTPVRLGSREEIFLDFRGERATLVRSDIRSGSESERAMHGALTAWYDTVWACSE